MKKKTLSVFPALLVLALIAPLGALAQEVVIPKQDELLKTRAEIQRLVDSKEIPSMAISVMKDGKLIWYEAIGYADIEKVVKATVDSVYPIGSVSKSITATGIMNLVNDGKLNLSQSINPLILPVELKDIDGNTPEIRLWQLISMNGGVNHSYGGFENESDVPRSDADKKRFFEQTAIVAFPPGTVYEYSNNAFYISEILIENVSKNSFQGFMDSKVFKPLLMKNTYAYPFKHKDQSDLVSTYTDDLRKITPGANYPSGGSGFWSSLSDLTRYAMFHLGKTKKPEVISDENLKFMHEFRQGNSDLFGIGWFNTGGLLVSDGSVTGGNARITVDRKNGLAVICLLNKTSPTSLADQFADKIRKVFVPDQDDRGFEEWRRIYGTPYSSRYELKGEWKGVIKQPVTGKTVPIELRFDESNEIEIVIGGNTGKLSNPKFNLFKELSGGFRAALPGIFDPQTQGSIKLKLEGDTLGGYIQYDDVSEIRSYRMPLFITLARH
jgi:CubicO group peptidase (beta-lactamase class C family)